MSRKLSTLISLVLALGLAASASADLVGHWKLDEVSGTIAADATGNGHNGTLIGSPEWVAGYSGGGLQFGGAPDKVDIPHSADLNPENEFSVSVWANLDPGGSGYRSPVTSRDAGPTAGYIIYCTPANTWQFWTGSSGGGWNTAGSPAAELGQWTHVAITYSGGAKKLYVNSELAGESDDVLNLNTARVLRIGSGATESNGNYFFQGVIDDVRVYNHVLTEAEMAMLSARPRAEKPDPADGAKLEQTWVALGWRGGDFAVSHDLYFGTSFDDVNTAAEGALVGNLATTSQVVGFIGFPSPDGLQPGTTYYWRVDGINEANPNSPWEGGIWSFWIPPVEAYIPSPSDAAQYVGTDVTLNWEAGFDAKLHYVHFGDSFDDVSNAAAGAPSVDATFAPGTLELGKTYYWRVDESNPPAAPAKSDVWSFTTLPDVESTDPNLVGWWTFDEGQGATAVDWSGHGNHGALTDNPQWVDGEIGSALSFDSSRVTVDASDSLTADLFQGSFTLAGWINPTRTGNMWQQILRAVAAGGNDTLFLNNDGTLSWRGLVGGAWAGGMCETAANVVPANQWTHFAVIGNEVNFRIYVNGDLSQESAFQTTDGANVTYYIGGTAGGESYSGMVDDLRVYNHVLTESEILLAMRGDLTRAWNPDPHSHGIVDIRDISSLSWSKGDTAVSHDVYFGTDRGPVAGADNSTPEFRGNQAGTSLSLAGLVEFGGGDYYWRIDEVEADGAVTAGTIWKFTVPDYLIVEDFESYNDLAEDDPASNRIYLTWIDGFGTTTNGAIAGNLDVPLMAPGRDSAQAMPVSYDNAGKTSEVTKTLTSGKDWTEQGVTKLVVWFSGASGNAADRMFVALGNAVVYHPDDAATQGSGWNEWAIDLQEFVSQGTNLSNVGSITLGFGTRNAPVAGGGVGTVEFDDIRLTR